MATTQSLHDKARNNVNITRRDLRNELDKPGSNIDAAPDGYSALAWAVKTGNLTNMRLLITRGANVSAKYGGQSLLHMAVTADKNPLDVVKCLLAQEHLDRNMMDDRFPNDTPLMTALRNNVSPDIIDALKKGGASETTRNSRGESAKDIANGLISPGAGESLLPKEEQNTVAPALMRFIVASVLLMLAYVRPWKTMKDALCGAFKQVQAELNKSYCSDSNKPKLPNSFKDVLDTIKDLIHELGLEDLFPDDCPFLEDVADKAWENQKDPDKKVTDPDEFKELCRCALYQPILYCDDSGSMKDGGRMTAMTDIVDDIAELLNTFAPDEKGVSIRFLNKNDTAGLDNLRGKDIRAKLNFTPDGATPLGTSLNNKILKPFVYDVFNNTGTFERPIIVITITDGEPNTEDVNTFQNGIVECSNKSSAAHYSADFVRFLVNQVGDDSKAQDFLTGLQGVSQQKKFRNLLHVTAERMDTKYYELRKNKRNLNQWLFKTILPPKPAGP